LGQDGVPGEWTITTAQWLQENNYVALPVLINDGMFPYGYGDIRQVPIVILPSLFTSFNRTRFNRTRIYILQLYMFQYFTPDIVVDFALDQNIFLIDKK
jgi:hypothetical protein